MRLTETKLIPHIFTPIENWYEYTTALERAKCMVKRVGDYKAEEYAEELAKKILKALSLGGINIFADFDMIEDHIISCILHDGDIYEPDIEFELFLTNQQHKLF